jgi:hypothetical protein
MKHLAWFITTLTVSAIAAPVAVLGASFTFKFGAIGQTTRRFGGAI